MPTFEVAASRFELWRNAMLLDTNVLVRAFGNEHDSSEVRWCLDELNIQWLVPIGVVVEAWGILVGRNKQLRAGYEMLRWLNTPGKAMVISQRAEDSNEVLTLVSSLGIDCVDAMLMLVATDITDACSYNPPLKVATYDVGDFYQGLTKPNLRYGVYHGDDFPEDPFKQ